jgi:hypothetical protein
VRAFVVVECVVVGAVTASSRVVVVVVVVSFFDAHELRSVVARTDKA